MHLSVGLVYAITSDASVFGSQGICPSDCAES